MKMKRKMFAIILMLLLMPLLTMLDVPFFTREGGQS